MRVRSPSAGGSEEPSKHPNLVLEQNHLEVSVVLTEMDTLTLFETGGWIGGRDNRKRGTQSIAAFRTP